MRGTEMTVQFVIGVDGGGTGCRVVIKDMRSQRTSYAEGGPSNVATDFEGAIHNVNAALMQAAQSLGFTLDDISSAAAHVGLAGIYNDELLTSVRHAFSFEMLSVSDDRAGAVEGFLDGQDGYVVVVGTGMIVGSSIAGAHRFVGGRGFQVSDHASGAWIGRQLLDLTLRCHDGICTHSDLTQDTLKVFGSDPHEIVALSLKGGPEDYASFAQSVCAAGQLGDPNAVTILDTGARHIEDALAALGFVSGDTLCLAGGVGPQYVSYLDPNLIGGLLIPEGTALDGALRIAERMLADP